MFFSNPIIQKSDQRTTPFLTHPAVGIDGSDLRVEACFRRYVQQIAEQAGKTGTAEQNQWIDLCLKLGFLNKLSKEEMTAVDVNHFVLALAHDSGKSFYTLCAAPGNEKHFPALLAIGSRLSANGPKKTIQDIQKVTKKLGENPFLLVSCLIPAFIQALLPNDSEHRNKLTIFKESLECFKPAFSRVAAGHIRDQSEDPLVQLGLSGLSKREFSGEAIATFIAFFSTLAKGDPTADLDKGVTKQGIDWLIEQVVQAHQTWKGWEGNAEQKEKKAIADRNEGQLSPIQEFLLIDLPDLSKGISITTLFMPLGMTTLDSKIGRKVLAGFMQFVNGASEVFTGKSVANHVLDDLRKKNPNSLIIKFLDGLGTDEREEISAKIEKEILPLLMVLAPQLSKKHNLDAYKVYLEVIKNQIQSSKETINKDEVTKAFASIFVSLLREIETHYSSAFESLYEAFWQIGQERPIHQTTSKKIVSADTLGPPGIYVFATCDCSKQNWIRWEWPENKLCDIELTFGPGGVQCPSCNKEFEAAAIADKLAFCGCSYILVYKTREENNNGLIMETIPQGKAEIIEWNLNSLEFASFMINKKQEKS